MKFETATWMYCITCLITFIPIYIIFLIARKRIPHVESHETQTETRHIVVVNGDETEE